MMRARTKGGPLKGLGLLLIAWISVRAATFSAVPTAREPGPEASNARPAPIAKVVEPAAHRFLPNLDPPLLSQERKGKLGRASKEPERAKPAIVAALSFSPRQSRAAAPSAAKMANAPIRSAQSDLETGTSAHRPFAPLVPAGIAALQPIGGERGRWSGDGWMLLRRGSGGEAGPGLRPSSYGASQAGAVLRYHLAPQSAHRPFAYARATTTLRGPSEQQAALGLGLRPIPRIPVSAAAEARIIEGAAGSKVQPAAFVFTELPPLPLPAKLQAELYAQAGYVGGAFATPFVDGQLRIDRPLASLGRVTARAGGGAWGGAQKGAARLDVGPSANLWFPLSSGGGARLALDWRLRVSGDARPDSGPALTLSAGF